MNNEIQKIHLMSIFSLLRLCFLPLTLAFAFLSSSFGFRSFFSVLACDSACNIPYKSESSSDSCSIISDLLHPCCKLVLQCLVGNIWQFGAGGEVEDLQSFGDIHPWPEPLHCHVPEQWGQVMDLVSWPTCRPLYGCVDPWLLLLLLLHSCNIYPSLYRHWSQ